MLTWFGWSSFVPAHDFHYSRADIHWSATRQTAQATVRMFTDDLERVMRETHAIAHPTKEAPRLWLGDALEWPGADSLAAAVLDENLVVRAEGHPLSWTWVGKEVSLDVTYLYLESDALDAPPAEWTVHSTLLLAQFEDQVNEVHLHSMCGTAEVERREMLDRKMPAFTWNVCP